MLNKKHVILLCSLLLCMVAVSSVSAAEDIAVGDELAVASDNVEIVDSNIDNEDMTNGEAVVPVSSQDDSGDDALGDGIPANVELTQNGTYYQSTKLDVVVRDNQTSDGIDGAKIYLEFSNGKNATITTQSGGIASYDINLAAGTYSVTASSADTNVSVFSPVTLNGITILPHNGKITITQSGKYSDNKVLTVKVYDQFTKKGFAQKVYLDFSNGKRTFVKTNADGVATYKMNFKPGTYWVKASATNSNVKLDEVKLSNVVITRTPVTFNPRPYAAYYASGKNFMVKVINYNRKPAVGVKVKIDIYTGKKKASVYRKTDASGWAQYPASKLAIGKHKVVVSVASNDLHSGKLKIKYITINKAYVDIYAPSNVQVAQNYDGKYGVKITHRVTGEPVANMNVQFKVSTDDGYKTYNVKTNKNGYAAIQTKGLSEGRHNVAVSAGNNYYNAAQKTGYFVTSDRIPTYIDPRASTMEGEYSLTGDTAQSFWIKLFDINNNWLEDRYYDLVLVDCQGTRKVAVNQEFPYTDTVWFNSNFTACSISFPGDSEYLPCKYDLYPAIYARWAKDMKRITGEDMKRKS